MQFEELSIGGAFLIRLEKHADERGSFARTFCRDEMARHGVTAHVEQCSESYNRYRGTLRGLHFQWEPHAEGKLVRCVAGAIFDVLVDVRPGSPTERQWLGFELHGGDEQQLWIPPGCAHGFLTLDDDTLVHYQMDTAYAPESGAGYRWNDPAFRIHWPAEPRVIAQKDLDLPLYPTADLAELAEHDSEVEP